MKNYGVALKALRKKSNITQASLAEKLNVTYQTVSKWENGVNTPDISVIENICDLFGITVDEFLRLADGDVDGLSVDTGNTEEPAPTTVASNVEEPAPTTVANDAEEPAPTTVANDAEEVVQSTETSSEVDPASATCPRCGNALVGRFCGICGYDSMQQPDNYDNSQSISEATIGATNNGDMVVARKRLGKGALASIIIAAVVAATLAVAGFVYGMIWSFTRYSTVTFSRGDGHAVGSMTSITGANGDKIMIPECSYKYTGYKFCGWQCGDKVYKAGDKVTLDGYDMTLTAKWEPVEYTVVYCYDGSEVNRHKYKYNESFTLPDALFSREGYDQTGWKYAGDNYGLCDKVSALTKTDNATIKFEAAWEPIRYIMTVDLVLGYEMSFDGKKYVGGGIVEIECVYGEEPLNTWERFDDVWSYCYTFNGYTVYDADGNLYEGDLRYINSDKTAKPHAVMNWSANKYGIHFMAVKNWSGMLDEVYVIECEGRNEYVLPLASEIFGENYKPGYRFKRWAINSSWWDDIFFEDGATVSCMQNYATHYGGGYDTPWCELVAEWEEIE